MGTRVIVKKYETPVSVNPYSTKVVKVNLGQQGPQGIPGIGAGFFGTVAENISGGRVVTSDSNGEIIYSNDIYPLGISTNAATIGGVVNILSTGSIIDPAFNFTPSLPIYQGLNGALTQLVPSFGFIQQVGIAKSQTEIAIGIKSPIILSS